MQAWSSIGQAADLLTIVAALLAISGAMSSWLTRPRVSVTATARGADSAQVYVTHVGGSRPARNLYYGIGILDDVGAARSGDLSSPWHLELVPGASYYFEIFDPENVVFAGPKGERETRIPLKRPSGLVLDVSWQRPLLPWLRTRRVIVWSVSDRGSGRHPRVLRGRKAARVFDSAMPTS
ncbi:hypothetical protein GCM10022282_26450 [Agromyces indicus]